MSSQEWAQPCGAPFSEKKASEKKWASLMRRLKEPSNEKRADHLRVRTEGEVEPLGHAPVDAVEALEPVEEDGEELPAALRAEGRPDGDLEGDVLAGGVGPGPSQARRHPPLPPALRLLCLITKRGPCRVPDSHDGEVALLAWANVASRAGAFG